MKRLIPLIVFIIFCAQTTLAQERAADHVYFQPRWASESVVQLSGNEFSGRWRGFGGHDMCRPCSASTTPLNLSLDGGTFSRSGTNRPFIALDSPLGPLTIGEAEYTNVRGFVKVFFDAPSYAPKLMFGRRFKRYYENVATVEIEARDEDNNDEIVYKDAFNAKCGVLVKTNRLGGQKVLFSTSTVEYFCNRIQE